MHRAYGWLLQHYEAMKYFAGERNIKSNQPILSIDDAIEIQIIHFSAG